MHAWPQPIRMLFIMIAVGEMMEWSFLQSKENQIAKTTTLSLKTSHQEICFNVHQS